MPCAVTVIITYIKISKYHINHNNIIISGEVDWADCGQVGPVRGRQPEALSLVVMDEEENMEDRPERGQV